MPLHCLTCHLRPHPRPTHFRLTAVPRARADPSLRLNIFEQLGFRVGESGRIIVINETKPDAHVEAVGEDRVATANRLWALSGPP